MFPVNEPVFPVNPAVTPPTAPEIRADLSASLILPPFMSVPIPDPRAAPYIGPRGVNAKAIGRMIGATFLITLTTALTTFLMPFQSLEKNPNSIKPVSGLILLASLPTTYCSGSSIPLSRNCLKICSFKRGLFSIRASGTTISPV